MTRPIELMPLFWTTAGVFGDMNAFSRFDFRDRVDAAVQTTLAAVSA